MSSSNQFNLETLNAAPAWVRVSYAGDTSNPYALEFTLSDGDYMFVPQSTINNGVIVGDNTSIFPYFLDQNNQKSFFSNVQSANDLSGQSWFGDYLKNHGLSTTGYFIKSDAAPFDSNVLNYKTKDIGTIRGIGTVDGDYGYITTGAGGKYKYGYIAPAGDAHNVWYEPGKSFLGEVFGGVGESIAGGIRDLASSINDLGPLGQIALATFSPLAASAMAGYNTGDALAKGAPLDKVAENLAANYVGSQIGAEVGADTGSNIAGGAASGASSAALKGGDISQGALYGGLSGGVKDAAQNISDSNLENWAQQQAAQAYDNSTSPTEQDVIDYMNREPATPAQQPDNIDIGGGYNPATGSSQANAPDNIDVGGGYNVATGQGDQGYYNASGNWVSTANNSPDQVVDTSLGGSYDPTLTKAQIEAGLNALKNAALASSKTSSQASNAASTKSGLSNYPAVALQDVPWLEGTASMLRNDHLVEQDKKQKNEDQAKDIYENISPELLKVFAERGILKNAREKYPEITGLPWYGSGDS